MRFSRFFAALAAVGWLATAVPVFAADPAPTGCNCWCTSKAGATSSGQETSSASCATTCKDKGEKIVVCSKKASELPANNLRCFESEEACKLNCQGPPMQNAKAFGSIYDTDYQPTECPSKYHYCYCTGESYQLAYKIPNPDPSKPPIGEVADIGSYVNTVYKYLLGISGLVAIVMIMIGGVQYVTSVATGSVKAAKERIQHAVIGLILLFCAALILQTVNPRLLTLQPPRLPALKRIELLDPNASCEALLKPDRSGKVYTLAGKPTNGTSCGSKDEVLKDRTGAQVAEGTVCTYRGCPDAKSCYIAGDKAQCIACKEAIPTSETGIVPTSGLCKQLQAGMQPAHGTDHPYCFWTKDPSMLFGANKETLVAGLITLGVGSATVVSPVAGAVVAGVALSQTDTLALRNGACAELRVDCTAIAIANENKTTCESYNVDRLQAVNALTDNELSDLYPGWGDQNMQTICEANPCKWAGGCTYDSVENTCRTSGSGVNLAECTEDSQCDNGNKCINRHCVRPNLNIGKNGEPCGTGDACDSGLTCVSSFPKSGGGMQKVCTDGQPSSPCNSNSDCKNAGASCVNYMCASSVSRANGTACADNFECQSNFCSGGLCRAGTTGENCGVTGANDSQCAPGFYCAGSTGPYSCAEKIKTGDPCTQNAQCKNGTCVGNGTDFVGNQGTCN